MSEFHTLTVSEIKKETPNSVIVSFAIPENVTDQFRFTAGQYLTLKKSINGIEVRRAYSICSSPNSGDLQVGIKKVADGTFSVYANDTLKTGDSLEVMLPEGKFTLEAQTGKTQKYIAFAAGSGITPVLSIIKSALEVESSSFVLFYGNRSISETMFYNEIVALQNKFGDRFHVEYIFSRTAEEGSLFGRIDKSRVNFLLKNKYSEVTFDRFFLCGPEPMINEITLTLKENGTPESAISYELFTSTSEGAPEEAHDGDTNITIIVDDETETFTMPQNKSVLEAALAQDIDAPYSCQGGICSTCIARITEGKVEMRKNQILTDDEVAEGLILTCQAHPTTAKVVIDYDDV